MTANELRVLISGFEWGSPAYCAKIAKKLTAAAHEGGHECVGDFVAAALRREIRHEMRHEFDDEPSVEADDSR